MASEKELESAFNAGKEEGAKEERERIAGALLRWANAVEHAPDSEFKTLGAFDGDFDTGEVIKAAKGICEKMLLTTAKAIAAGKHEL